MTQQHFLSIDQFDKEAFTALLQKADTYRNTGGGSILKNKTVANLFFEPSTRTLVSFELAAKRLGATVVNLDIQKSSAVKGEEILDTLLTLQAMHCDYFVVRHQIDETAKFLADQMPQAHIINAGDGKHAHPSQALLDMLTIKQHKPDFSQLTVAIVGDIKHSRVASSDIAALTLLGVKKINLIGPEFFIPENLKQDHIEVFNDINSGLKDVDVAMTLRIQKERLTDEINIEDYIKQFCLTTDRLAIAKPDAIVMHPGPMNRGIEITTEVANGPQSVILEQVTNGIAARMAIFDLLT